MSHIAITGTLPTADTARFATAVMALLAQIAPRSVLLAGTPDLNAAMASVARAQGITIAGCLQAGPDGMEGLIAGMDAVVRVARHGEGAGPNEGGRAEAVAEAAGRPVYTLTMGPGRTAVVGNATSVIAHAA